MVSLGKLINEKKEVSARYAKMLIQGISRTAVESDPDETTSFRRTVDGIALGLPDETGREELLVKIGAVLHALEEYNRRANKSSQAYRAELKGVLATLTETVAFLGASSRTGIEQLKVIEKTLESTTDITEIRVLRYKLAGCLTLVRNESARRQVESEQLIKSLKAAVVRASTQILPSLAGAPPDSATGLAGPAAVEQLIAKLIAEGKTFTVTVFSVDQLPALNARFGRAVGDEILLLTAQHLAGELAECGTLLRWNGPAFVFVAEESETQLETVERRIKEVGATRFERTISVDQRSVHFKVTFSWLIRQVKPSDSAETVCRHLDSFVASPAGTSSVTSPASTNQDI